LLQSLVAPALLTIQHDLDTTTAGAAWILTAYLLSASVVTPIAGRLGDMYGKKRTMVVVLVVLAFGTLLAALATSIGVMIAARVIQGPAARSSRSPSRSSGTSSRRGAYRTGSP
jgi:MFS family permease